MKTRSAERDRLNVQHELTIDEWRWEVKYQKALERDVEETAAEKQRRYDQITEEARRDEVRREERRGRELRRLDFSRK